ncbi:Glyoxalase family protein [Staphylococcus aureus]|nr:Glyoxalase family protein [Staphylococcus aureus]
MTTFYKNILGLSVKSSDDNTTVLSVGTGGHTLTLHLLEDGRQTSPREAGLFHIAFLLPTTEDLANFLYFVAQKNMGIGAGDHLVRKLYISTTPKVMVLKSIAIDLHLHGNGKMAKLKWIL